MLLVIRRMYTAKSRAPTRILDIDVGDPESPEVVGCLLLFTVVIYCCCFLCCCCGGGNCESIDEGEGGGCYGFSHASLHKNAELKGFCINDIVFIRARKFCQLNLLCREGIDHIIW